MTAAPAISAAAGDTTPVAAGQVAIQISGLMRGNTRCTELRQRLAALWPPGGPPDDTAAGAAVEREIQEPDRITAWQVTTADWRLGKARRLQGQARQVNGPEDPAATQAPGQAIDAETARQPGGCGRAGGA